MRKTLTAVVVAAQVLVLAFMVGEREYIVSFGRQVYLRTAPLDPRDLFRGDFVRLDYEISSIARQNMLGTLSENLGRKGLKVFTVLNESDSGLAELDFATDVEPADRLFLRGRLTDVRRAPSSTRPVRVKYGIEQMFVEQWKGKEIEQRRGVRDGLQVPLEVEVAVAGSGKSVLTGYRWSRLGIQLAVLRMPERDRNADVDTLEGPLSPRVRIGLHNVSEQPLALVNPGDNCAFELLALGSSGRSYAPTSSVCDDVGASDADVVELEPGQSYETEIDLSEPRWHVITDDVTGEIGRLAEFDRFRLVYRAPAQSTARGLSAAKHIWLGHIQTPAFNAFGRID